MPAVHDGGGSGRPDWLTRTDTSGADDVLSFLGSGGSGVRVEPDALKDFSGLTTAQGVAFQSGYVNGVLSLVPTATSIGTSTSEAAAFAAKHQYVVQQMQMLAQDVGIGLGALGQGAQTIALNYLDADATQAATMAQVTDAFSPDAEHSFRNGALTAAPSEGLDAQEEQDIQDVVDDIEAALPPPDDMTPDVAFPEAAVDPRLTDQVIDLGDSGDTYVIPADDDIETRDHERVLLDDAARRYEDHDRYDPTEE